MPEFAFVIPEEMEGRQLRHAAMQGLRLSSGQYKRAKFHGSVMLDGTPDDVRAAYRAAYAEGLVRYVEGGDEGGFLSSAKYAGRDDMEVSVYGNDERIVLVSRFDNLGKGASGAAIQNMNLALGVPETTGLVV